MSIVRVPTSPFRAMASARAGSVPRSAVWPCREQASPVIVVMGERAPDFKDPGAEARWLGETLGGEVVMVPDAGHYPQSQQPELTSAAVLSFLSKVHDSV